MRLAELRCRLLLELVVFYEDMTCGRDDLGWRLGHRPIATPTTSCREAAEIAAGILLLILMIEKSSFALSKTRSEGLDHKVGSTATTSMSS